MDGQTRDRQPEKKQTSIWEGRPDGKTVDRVTLGQMQMKKETFAWVGWLTEGSNDIVEARVMGGKSVDAEQW